MVHALQVCHITTADKVYSPFSWIPCEPITLLRSSLLTYQDPRSITASQNPSLCHSMHSFLHTSPALNFVATLSMRGTEIYNAHLPCDFSPHWAGPRNCSSVTRQTSWEVLLGTRLRASKLESLVSEQICCEMSIFRGSLTLVVSHVSSFSMCLVE